jgi:hypothetical protein
MIHEITDVPHNTWFHPLVFFLFFFFFVVPRIGLNACLLPLEPHPQSVLFCFLFFRQGLALTLPWPALNLNPPTYASWVTGIAGIYHHTRPHSPLAVCFVYSTGVWTQRFALARQVLYHFSHASSLFCFSLFLGLASDWDPPTTAWVAGIIDNVSPCLAQS